MRNEFTQKVILVTGGTGTIGAELVRQLLKYNPRQVRVFSRDDTKQYQLLESLGYPKNLRLFLGDIRDRDRLRLAFEDVDIVFHAAALKHVSIAEYNPFEAVKTNVIGSQNVIDVALERGVKKVIGISTDKAVNPTGILGTTKLLMEKLFINANYYKGKSPTVFSCVRFGNVAWSRGSVFPVWKEQLSQKKEIRVTNREMTRFFMSQDQAINLVLKAAILTKGGEIFVLKMPAASLADLSKIFTRKYANGRASVKIVGGRGGEKIHEDLLDTGDLYKKVFEDDGMFIILPHIDSLAAVRFTGNYPGFKDVKNKNQYSSADNINIEAVANLL